MFGVNLETGNEIIVDEELDKFLKGLKVDYNQFYRGIVVENLDPEVKGRIKVRIPQIYGASPNSDTYLPTSSIPWANCAIHPAGNDSGTFLPPNIGDTVFVAFESGLPTSPIYFGGIWTTRNEDEGELIKGVSSSKVYNGRIAPVTTDDLPLEVVEGTERILYKSLKGAIIYIDDQDGHEKIQITDQSGQSIIMENLSLEPVRRRGNTTGRNQRSQIVLTNSAGDSITLSDGKIHLKSENILFETDNFKQISLGEFTDEINLADIILGKSESLVTLNFRNMRTGESLVGTTTNVYKITESSEELIGTYSYISEDYLELNLSSGEYRINTMLSGYYDSNINISVIDETPQSIDVFMSRETTEDNIQLVLTWNGNISDMDSHTKVYRNNEEIAHVFYSNANYDEEGINVVNLDVDDTDYYGPETTTINKSFSYNYLYYIHRYTGGIDISTSGCNVKVYDKGRLIQEVNLSQDTHYSDEYAYWKVLSYDMNTGQVTILNQVVNSEPSL